MCTFWNFIFMTWCPNFCVCDEIIFSVVNNYECQFEDMNLLINNLLSLFLDLTLWITIEIISFTLACLNGIQHAFGTCDAYFDVCLNRKRKWMDWNLVTTSAESWVISGGHCYAPPISILYMKSQINYSYYVIHGTKLDYITNEWISSRSIKILLGYVRFCCYAIGIHHGIRFSVLTLTKLMN